MNIYGPQIFVGSAIIFVSPMCLIKLICICRLNTSSGRSRGGGPKKQCSVKNVLCQYLYTIYIPDAMELWALGPHAIFVMVIYTLGSRRIFQSDIALCGLHEFVHLNVADIQKGKSEKVSGTVSASPLLLVMTVISSSGVIASPPEVPVRNIMDAVSTGTPFVVSPAPGIERLVMQAQDFSTCRLSKSHEFLSLFRPSASSPAPTLLRDSAKDPSPILLLDRVPPLCWNTSPHSIRGQNPLGLCLDVRLSGLYCRPDPPVLPTGSALRISTTLPE